MSDYLNRELRLEADRKQQIDRIRRFESIMQEAEAMLGEYSYENAGILREKIEELETYYSSDEWKQDFTDDEAGLLPQDLKRGVLSEDGIFNLLARYREN